MYSATIPYEGRDILLLDDIVDTGITLNFLLDHIREKKPRSLKVCALINKPGERKIDVHPDWSAFTLDQAPHRPLPGGLRPRPRREPPRAALHRDHPPSRPGSGRA